MNGFTPVEPAVRELAIALHALGIPAYASMQILLNEFEALHPVSSPDLRLILEQPRDDGTFTLEPLVGLHWDDSKRAFRTPAVVKLRVQQKRLQLFG